KQEHFMRNMGKAGFEVLSHRFDKRFAHDAAEFLIITGSQGPPQGGATQLVQSFFAKRRRKQPKWSLEKPGRILLEIKGRTSFGLHARPARNQYFVDQGCIRWTRAELERNTSPERVHQQIRFFKLPVP